MILRSLAAFLASALLLGASPAPQLKLEPVPNNAQTAVLRRYVEALKNARYADAFALLNPSAQAYFRNAKNFAGVFAADDFSIGAYHIAGTRGDAKARVYVVRETVNFKEPGHDELLATTLNVPYGVLGNGTAARIKDTGKPWRAYASAATQTTSRLRITVRKVAFYNHYVSIVATFANAGDSYLTLLPYNRTVLRDARGTVYPLISNKNWAVTDRKLFLGLRLAPDEQYTGSLSFASPTLDDTARRFTLTVAPNLRDGTDEPFTVEVADIGPRG